MKQITAYKVIGRCSKTKRQVKKRVYTSLRDFGKYSEDVIDRYERIYGIAEVWYLINDKWELKG